MAELKKIHITHISILGYVPTNQISRILEDAIRLRLFSHMLRDKAFEWLDSLPIASITTRIDLAHKFCTKYFSPAKITKMRHEISIFSQGEFESFDEAWNIFKNMFRKCPQHGFDKKTQIRFFYIGLLPYFKSMVDSSSDDSISTRTIDGALELFERMATTSAMWSSKQVIQKKPSGVYEVDAYSALSAKINSLFNKVESISQSTNATYVLKLNCEECGRNHSTTECPILSQGMEQIEYTQWDGANGTCYDKRAPNTLPRNTELNPNEHVQAITTRSGIQLPERHVERLSVNTETTPSTKEEIVQQNEQTRESTPKKSLETSRGKTTIPINPYEPPIPFPQRLKKQGWSSNIRSSSKSLRSSTSTSRSSMHYSRCPAMPSS
ncbi:uncharacterized protein LOC111400629 [Olea europaea var. sylvestris]|uniref:uncharacterized protein LOC111400629 n=1 Tax=Olea europaea var. sylvestris TaxID=158386 RepID=UPI000C1D02B6|nr:uncharacterized protein LOC111400629 [Olea europaea var. sylvestris]